MANPTAGLYVLLGIFMTTSGQGQLQSDPTYVVVTPTKVRPNQDVVISATILKLKFPDTITIHTVIRYLVHKKPAEEISSAQHTFSRPGSHDIILKTPPSMLHGNYSIKVSGFSDPRLKGLIFTNETGLSFDSKQVSVFIFPAKPWYSQKQIVRFRIIPLTTELMPVITSMDVSLVNTKGLVVREWYSLHTNTQGVISLAYPLAKQYTEYGEWTIVAKCLGHTYKKTFVVEEYYGPLFHTRIVTPNYMYQSSKALTGKIDSWWINTYPIKGNATVKVDFFHADTNTPADIPQFKHPIPYFDTTAKFAIPTNELAAHAGSEKTLIGKRLKVSVAMLDWWWNKTYTEYDSIYVYSDQIQLKFLGGNVWTFKPNAPFKIYIVAQKADQSPVESKATEFEEKIELVVTRQDSDATEETITEYIKIPKKSIVEYWLRPNTKTERITVSATYGGRVDTTQKLVATRHWSPNNHYLHISTSTNKPKVGQYIIFNIETNTFIDYVYYHIVSSGNIILSDRLAMHSRHRLLSIAVTRKMSPDAKIVAFYIAPDRQVAADSLQFHVDATGLHKITLGIGRGKDLSAEEIKVGLKTKPLSYVGIAFQRIEIYNMGGLNSFTWPEVNRELATFGNHTNKTITHYWKKNGQVIDTFYAATPSFAHDANSTFYYSGLYIFTDANVSSVYTACNRTKGEYPCMDGKSCYKADHICDTSAVCARDQRDEMGCPHMLLPEVVEDPLDEPLNDIRPLWGASKIHAYQNDVSFGWLEKYTKQSGGNAITVVASPIGIKWALNGFALNQDHGLAISDPIIQPLQMWIYLILKGESKLRLGETLALRVLVTNKYTQPVDALISVPASKDYKVVRIEGGNEPDTSNVDGEQQILVSVSEKGKKMIYIPIEPTRTGSITVPVKMLSVVGGHTKKFKFTVGHDGIPDANITSYQVDLRTRNAERLPDLYISVEEFAEIFEQGGTTHVAGSAKSVISVIGDIIGISFFPSAKYYLQTGNLIGKQPSYSGHEATFNFAMNLYTLDMMRSLGKISTSKVKKVTDNMNIAIQEMLAYWELDGSFKEFRWNYKSSTWLSAVALEVMADGVLLSDVGDDFQMPVQVLNTTSLWLIGKQDQRTGRFLEEGTVHNRIYASKTDIETDEGTVDGNLALTALCVASLKKAADVTSLDAKVVRAIELGSGYLASHYAKTNDPLEMAIVTHTLLVAGENSASQQAMFRLRSMKRTERDMTYWSIHNIPAIKREAYGLDNTVRLMPKKGSTVGGYTVTATSYALLAFLENGESAKEMDSIQKFLQEQHLSVGGFYSSHDTLRAMQALTKLAERDQDRATYDMTFTFRSDQDKDWVHSIHLNQDNWFELQQVTAPSHWGTIQATARGHGIALVHLRTTKTIEDDRDQLKKSPHRGIFDLGDFNREITTRGFNHSFIDFKLCPMWTGESEQSGMVVLEVFLPSGYKASNWGSQKLVKKKRSTTSLRAAQHLGGLEVFYFDYINKSRLNCVEFTSYRSYPVATVAELTKIKIYEYYEPTNFLLTYYEKVELNKLTPCLVCGSYQCPYCPFYSAATSSIPHTFMLYLAVFVSFFPNILPH
ncbi:CD109 antigen-like [Watersipora subatra]|uniref:CD109 antigen-like n=1 Tax=Watersipora subatra TaxID=2589382 RepID=UPI00355AEEF7